MMSLALPSLFTTLQIPLLYIINITSLALGPAHPVLRYAIFLPLFVLLVSQSLYREWAGVFGLRYAMECMVWSVTWVYFDWNILCGPDGEGWEKTTHDDGDGEKKDAGKGMNGGVKKGFGKRMWWAVRLATTQRYTGWTNEVKNVRKEVDADYSRWLFVIRKALRYGIFFLLHDAANAYTASSAYGAWADIAHIKPTISLMDQVFLTRFYWAWVHICLTYVALEEVNALYGAVSVATGLANPRDCPSAFGDLKGLVTVRKAWSSVWHQNCRRICSAPGIFIARDVLHLRKGSFASKYLQLFVGFGVSGIVHGCASMFAHRSFNDDVAFRFFLGQAIIIMIEDHVVDFGKSLGLNNSAFWRLVGFAWTFFAIGGMSQDWTARVVDHGMWIHDRGVDVFGIGPPALL